MNEPERFEKVSLIIAAIMLALILVGGIVGYARADSIVGVSHHVTTNFQGEELYELNTGVYYTVEAGCTVPNYIPVVVNDTGIYDSHTFGGSSAATVSWETEVIDTCFVLGVIGSPQSHYRQNDLPIYAKDSKTLYLYNVRVFDALQDTGIVFSRAILQREELENFILISVE